MVLPSKSGLVGKADRASKEDLESIRRKSIKTDIDELFKIFDKYNVGGMVMGLPLSLDGSDNYRVQKVKKFAKETTSKK